MAMKTNKSYAKRLKVTKSGKVLARRAGINHFNAKKKRTHQLKQRKLMSFGISHKAKSRFLVNM
jgi:ribosomal protein L35